MWTPGHAVWAIGADMLIEQIATSDEGGGDE